MSIWTTGFALLAILAGSLPSVAELALTGASAPHAVQRAIVRTGEGSEAARTKVNREFEVAALQALLSPVLNSERSGLFGTGSAGKYWRSMMSENIARHLAASGQLRLLPLAQSTKMHSAGKTAASDSPARPRVGGCRLRVCTDSKAWEAVLHPSPDIDALPLKRRTDILETGEHR